MAFSILFFFNSLWRTGGFHNLQVTGGAGIEFIYDKSNYKMIKIIYSKKNSNNIFSFHYNEFEGIWNG